MQVSSLYRRRPVATPVSAAFVVALAVTAAYYAGVVPGVPKTLSTFVRLLSVTAGLLVATAVTWAASLAT